MDKKTFRKSNATHLRVMLVGGDTDTSSRAASGASESLESTHTTQHDPTRRKSTRHFTKHRPYSIVPPSTILFIIPSFIIILLSSRLRYTGRTNNLCMTLVILEICSQICDEYRRRKNKTSVKGEAKTRKLSSATTKSIKH